MPEIRILNDEGIRQFSLYIDRLLAGAVETPPTNLLTEPPTSEPFPVSASVTPQQFQSKMDAAKYLHRLLERVDRQHVDVNHGLWCWLALYFFDQLCPAAPDGTREPNRAEQYILPPEGNPDHFRLYYRHLLAGPFRIYRFHRDRARALLHPSAGVHGDFSEQLASRQDLITNNGLIEAVDILYYNADRRSPKRGATNRKKGGTLRRLITLMQQLDLTYDVFSMTGGQIVALLPGEFDRWRSVAS